MLLRRLALANFRNYVRLGLELEDGPSVFLGDNGQGKSNLLEAVYFLATTRSFRSNNERELVRWGARDDSVPFARINAHVRRADAEPHIDIVLRGENGTDAGGGLAKTIKANDTGHVYLPWRAFGWRLGEDLRAQAPHPARTSPGLSERRRHAYSFPSSSLGSSPVCAV